MDRLLINNREGNKIKVVINQNKKNAQLVIIMPGLSGNTEQPHIKAFGEAFHERDFTTLTFDPGNSLGESYGSLEDCTTTQQLNDLEDVIHWISKQEFYREPFFLVGHSLGAFCVLLYTENNPGKVKAIAPISTVVSGKMNIDRYPADLIKEWKNKGIREWKSYSGQIKRLKWGYMEDGAKYDTLKKIEKITMPCLLLVGEKDIETPTTDHKILYEKLVCKKELHIIKGAEHAFRKPEHLKEVEMIIKRWIDKIEDGK